MAFEAREYPGEQAVAYSQVRRIAFVHVGNFAPARCAAQERPRAATLQWAEGGERCRVDSLRAFDDHVGNPERPVLHIGEHIVQLVFSLVRIDDAWLEIRDQRAIGDARIERLEDAQVRSL